MDLMLCAAAHDLKRPFNTILLTADLLLRHEGAHLSASVRGELSRVARTAARGERMVSDFISHIRLASMEGPSTVVDLGLIVAEIVAELSPWIHARGVRVTCGLLPAVRGRAPQLRRVLENLIDNAVKCVPKGRGEVRIIGQKDGNRVIVRVHDNGFGLPQRFQQQIFGRAPVRVTSTEEAGQSGSGIGLAIVKKIVEGHGGTVRVESRTGAGSCFVVALPTTGQGERRGPEV